MEQNPLKAGRFFRPGPVSLLTFAGLKAQLDSLYGSNNHDLPDLADSGDLFSFEEVREFTKKVYEGAFKNGSFDKARVNDYAKVFGKGIEKGFKSGGGNLTPDFETPDAKMLTSLRDNVFQFSAAKNRTEIEAMSAALRDKTGKLRTFNEFQQEAQKITGEFQGRYLKTEYNLAVNAATMAARWTEYEEDAILVYETAHDNRVRPAHAALDGIAKPKNDKFWDTYYPPNGWNCRCTVMPTTSGRITPDAQLPPEAIDGVPPLFRSNFAKQGLAFPKDHPYFKTADLLDAHWQHSITPYVSEITENGFKVFQSNLSKTQSSSKHELKRIDREFKQKKLAAMLMAEKYKEDCLLLPEVDAHDIRYTWEYLMRGYRFKPKKCDCLLTKSNTFFEVKSYEKSFHYSVMKNMLDGINEQANVGVIVLKSKVPMEQVEGTFKNALKRNSFKNIKEIYVITRDKKLIRLL